MVKRSFSTAHPSLDTSLGGIFPGDSLLLLSPSRDLWTDFADGIVQHACVRRIPLVYISLGTTSHKIESAVNIIGFEIGRKTPKSKILPSLKRFLARQKVAPVVVLAEDLSQWKSTISNEKQLIGLLDFLVQWVADKGGFLVSAAVKSEFSLHRLGQLKDLPTLSLDAIQIDREVFFLPLTLKGRYVPGSLVPARVRREVIGTPSIQETVIGELRKTELDSLPATPEQILPSVFDQSRQPMVVFSLRGDLREFNHAAVEVLGYSAEELKVQKPITLIAEYERFRFYRFIVELRRRKRHHATFSVHRKNGKSISIDVFASALREGHFVAVFHDSTQEAEKESALRQLEADRRAMVEGLSAGLVIAYEQKVLQVNTKARSMFGYDDDELQHLKRIKSLFSTASWKQVQQWIRLTQEEATGSIDAVGIRKDNSIFNCRLYRSDIKFHNKSCLQLLVIDTTAEQAAREQLMQSEFRYRTVAEESPHSIAVVKDDTFVYANRSFLQMFGLSKTPEDKTFTSLLQDKDQNRLQQEILKRKGPAKHQPIVFEPTIERPDGSHRQTRAVIHPFTEGWMVFVDDLTSQKEQERQAKKQSDETKLLQEVIFSSTASLDADKLFHSILARFLDLFHWECGAVYQYMRKENVYVLQHQKNLPEHILTKLSSLPADEGIGGFAAKMQEPKTFAIERYPSYLPYRSLFAEAGWKNMGVIPLVAAERAVGLVLGGTKKLSVAPDYSNDFLSTLAKQYGLSLANAETFEAAKTSSEQYLSLVETSHDVLYRAEPNGSFTLLSPAVEYLTGFPAKEFYRNISLWLSLVHADDKRLLLERTAHINELGASSVLEYRLLPKGKAAQRWVREEIHIHRDSRNTITGLIGSISDITESRTALDEIRKKVDLPLAILNSIQDGIVVFDKNFHCLEWNEPLQQLTGINSSDAVGRYAHEIFQSSQEADVTALLHQTLQRGSANSHKFRFTVDGEARKLCGRFSLLQGADEDVKGILGVFSDVSVWKSREQQLRDSEQVLRNVIDSMDDILLITDLQGSVIQVNRSFQRVLGFERAEIIGKEFPYPWILDDEMGRYLLWISNLRERNWLHDFDMTWRSKEGKQVSISLSTTLLRNSLGEPIAMLNIARDITERTRLANDLETRSKQMEMINRIISKANQTTDFDEILHSVSDEIRKLVQADIVNVELLSEGGVHLMVYATSGQQLLKKGDHLLLDNTISQHALRSKKTFIVSDLTTEFQDTFLTQRDSGIRSQIALPIILKGKPFGVLTIGSREPHVYNEDHGKILEPIAQQIGTMIDRIQLFQKVTEDSVYIRNLLDSIDSIVYTVDRQHRILEVNKAWFDFMRDSGGAIHQDYHGLDLFEVLTDESLITTYKEVFNNLLTGRVDIFSEEIVQQRNREERVYHLTINPMVIRDEVIGLVITQTDITELKQTENELKRNNEQLLAMNEISSLMSTSFRLEEILHSALPLLKSMLSASSVMVYLIDENNTRLNLIDQTGFDLERFPSVRTLEQGGSATGEAVASKQPIFVSKEATENLRIVPQNREILRQAEIESMAVIPLISKGIVLGALDVFYRTPHEFVAQERQLLSLIGNQLGTAVENVKLYDQLRSQVDRLTVLYELSQQLTSTLNLGQIFSNVFENVRQIISFDRFSIELYDANYRTLTPTFLVETIGGEKTFIPQVHQAATIGKETPQWNVISTENHYLTPDARSIYLPMFSKESIIGIMSLQRDAGEGFGSHHLQLLDSIANLTAIALEKGILYEETVQKSIEIERRNKELDDFTYVVSHDLKEPLISIEGFSRILQLDYGEIIQAEGKEYLDSIVGASTRMKGLIDDLLMLSRLSRPSESFKMVAVKDIINDIFIDMEFTVRQKGVSVVMGDDLPVISANETQLKILFRNLIGNAIKFNNKPNPVVEVGFRNTEKNSYLFFVRDNGIGIEREFFEKIFVIFQRLHRREAYEGSGAGLAIVKKIVEMHKGQIWVESEVGIGTTFYFTIPMTPEL